MALPGQVLVKASLKDSERFRILAARTRVPSNPLRGELLRASILGKIFLLLREKSIRKKEHIGDVSIATRQGSWRAFAHAEAVKRPAIGDLE